MLRINGLLVFCSFQLLFFWKICGANRPKLNRYVIEGDLKPAIFGSYSFDMVNGNFVVSNVSNSTTEINLTDIILNRTSTSVVDGSYRKHEGTQTIAVKTLRTFNWWTQARELLKNTTLYKHHFVVNKTSTRTVNTSTKNTKTVKSSTYSKNINNTIKH